MGTGVMGEKRERGKQRNMNRGLMGMDNMGELTVGMWGTGPGRAMGKRQGNCN